MGIGNTYSCLVVALTKPVINFIPKRGGGIKKRDKSSIKLSSIYKRYIGKVN